MKAETYPSDEVKLAQLAEAKEAVVDPQWAVERQREQKIQVLSITDGDIDKARVAWDWVYGAPSEPNAS